MTVPILPPDLRAYVESFDPEPLAEITRLQPLNEDEARRIAFGYFDLPIIARRLNELGIKDPFECDNEFAPNSSPAQKDQP